MEPTYWYKQSASGPLFKEVHWSKPENRRTAGKLLIVGGNAHSLNAPGMAYQAAVKAGIGTARVILPDAVAGTIGKSFDEGQFAFSTPSGSFAKTAINQILEESQWADAVLLAGDFGRNSETAILLEELLLKYAGPVVITQDAADYFIGAVGAVVDRENTILTTNLTRLQKMTRAGMPSILIRHSMSMQALAGLLNSWSRESNTRILTEHNGYLIYGDQGRVSSTPFEPGTSWEVSMAAYAATWWLQQPNLRFEAVTTGIFDFVSGLPTKI